MSYLKSLHRSYSRVFNGDNLERVRHIGRNLGIALYGVAVYKGWDSLVAGDIGSNTRMLNTLTGGDIRPQSLLRLASDILPIISHPRLWI